jgi:hypothetical protein
MKLARLALMLFCLSTSLSAREELFERGNQEFGLGELGLGYSNVQGFLFAALAQYQYFVIDRLSVGGGAFYRNFGPRDRRFENYGAGPSASWYFWTSRDWFAALGQNLIFSHYNGPRENVSFTTTTSSLGLNYFLGERTALGVSLNYSHALDGKRILQPFFVGAGFRAFF